MTEQPAREAHVAVYFDFDNIVISRYEEVHGQGSWREDKVGFRPATGTIRERLALAHVDVKAILAYAASFGTVSISRAYANWAAPANSRYGPELSAASIDLVQMFPLTGSKNGADIRLAIDVIDDLSRYDYLTHVLIVAGDSDYVSLAQRCKRLGRKVIGVGAARSVGRLWKLACDEFRYYEDLSATEDVQELTLEVTVEGSTVVDQPPSLLAVENLEQSVRALQERSAGEWVTAIELKALMKRRDPAFNESALGFSAFSQFLYAHPQLVDVMTTDHGHLVRLRSLET